MISPLMTCCGLWLSTLMKVSLLGWLLAEAECPVLHFADLEIQGRDFADSAADVETIDVRRPRSCMCTLVTGRFATRRKSSGKRSLKRKIMMRKIWKMPWRQRAPWLGRLVSALSSCAGK